MAGRDRTAGLETGPSLPAFDRLAPPPDPELVSSRLEAYTRPGDVVIDLHGRGGWVARAAVARQRRGVSFESTPLTRLLSSVTLRPPDVRHLDAAFQAIAAAPRGQSSLKVSLGELFATRCATCGRNVVVDEFIWEAPGDGPPRPIRKHYRCSTCRAQQGGSEQRQASLDDADRARLADVPRESQAWYEVRDRFPTLDAHESLVDELLALHTPRQLTYLHAILGRIETDLRAPQVEAALRLALLHALLPASRLNTYPGRVAALKITAARVRLPSGSQWRERNPWLAFEDGYRQVRAFVQRLEASPLGSVQARIGEDLLSLTEGMTNAVVRLGSSSAFRDLAREAAELRDTELRRHAQLVLGQPPLRWNQDRLSYAYFATAWVLGRDAAASLPLEPLFGSAIRPNWGWQTASLRRSLAAIAPLLARDARATILLDGGGAEGLVAAVLGGVAAGYRLTAARLTEPDEAIDGWVELVPPGAVLAPGPRSRAGRPLPPLPGGAGDPGLVRSRSLFAPPERIEAGVFSLAEATRAVTDTVVEVLQARGEPAPQERLLGEILVGLDRSGQLRRFVAARTDGAGSAIATPPTEPDRARKPGDSREGGAPPGGIGASHRASLRDPAERASAGGLRDPLPALASAEPVAPAGRPVAADGTPSPLSLDPVEGLLGLVRDEITRPGNRRLVEIEPGRWWLAQAQDAAGAAAPLSDRVEWAVFSLLTTSSRLSEAAFYERIAALFTGHDLPDEALVRACLDSYRSIASTPDAIQASDDLGRRSEEHSRVIGLLVEQGHRLGMRAWIARREQTRRVNGVPLADWLDDQELRAYLPLVGRAHAEDLEHVDCIWYVRHRATFLFEVEWTAMLGDLLLRKHAPIPTNDQLVRFFVVAPERTELLRFKLDRSPLLRRALEEQNWHILKWNHLKALAARPTLELGDVEPYLGLDPAVERQGEQMPLFGGRDREDFVSAIDERPAPAISAASTVNELADAFWEKVLELNPTTATVYGDERYDDRLADPGPVGRSAARTLYERTLEAIDAIPVGDLPLEERITRDMLRVACELGIVQDDQRVDVLKVVDQIDGPQSLLPQVVQFQRADTPERFERLVARLHAYGPFVAASIGLLQEGLASGLTAARIVTARTIAQTERLLATPVEASPVVVLPRLADESARERLASTVRDVVYPALGAFLEALRGDYLAASRQEPGVWSAPNGEAIYRTQVLAWTTLELDPQELHRIGLEELAAIEEERRAISRQLGLGDDTARLRQQVEDDPANRPASREALADRAREDIGRARAVASGVFGRLPRATCDVRLVEPFMERDAPFAYYYPPATDGSRPGSYFVNAYDLASRRYHRLASTTYHEAVPGHHFQIALEMEHPDLPVFRRLGSRMVGAAYVEGWGLYAERLADELGLYRDAQERLGMLDGQAWRAARLVVDTGLHALRWTREESIQKLRASGLTETDAVIETDRYIVWPGQALAYKVGQREIERLRRELAARDGAAFDLRTFHDAVLGHGSLPLATLARELPAWVAPVP